MSDFPYISNINDVLPAIDLYSEFIVADRDPFLIINYIVNYKETFLPDGEMYCDGCHRIITIENWKCGSQRCPPWVDTYEIRRECRGLVFDKKTGKIISRRYQKFFNLGEIEETRNIDLSKPHVILEKLDGSMISVIKHPETKELVCLTKMGITDTSKNADAFLQSKPHYLKWCSDTLTQNITPIFEWCSRKNRIVIDYPEDRLVLTAMRHNHTGEYIPYDQMKKIANFFDIDCVKTVTLNNLEEVKSFLDMEGVVIRFDDGNMIKIKAEDYVLKHKTKESVIHEKTVIEIILKESLDDVLPLLDDDYRNKIVDFNDNLLRSLQFTIAVIDAIFDLKSKLERKEFALSIQSADPYYKSILFEKYKNPEKSIKEITYDLIRKNLSSQTKVDQIRSLWGGYKLNLTNNNE
jgi:T4 RnlA family RNA ligase